MRVGGLFTAIRTTLSGLGNQMKRLDAISENIANAERAPDAKGRLYRRKIVVPEGSKLRAPKMFGDQMRIRLQRTDRVHMSSKPINPAADQDNPFPVKVVEENGFKLIYNPGHPRADENGYVKMPDINPVEEMVDLIGASRTYDANVTVLDASKQMAKRALEI